MTRALVAYERRSTDDVWVPIAVFQAQPDRLEGRALPGDPARDAWLTALLSIRQPPERLTNHGLVLGDYEDWIAWALGSLADGEDRATAEVEQADTIDALYEREMVGTDPSLPALPSKKEDAIPYWVPARDRSDALLRRHLPGEQPDWFRRLPRHEQAWRGRIFLITWTSTYSAAFAWATARVTDPTEVAASVALVARITDDRIAAEMKFTAGMRQGVHFVKFVEPSAWVRRG